MTNRELVIGVLALQGGVQEHCAALHRCGVAAVPVRRASELEQLDGIILPGGESTTMSKLLVTYELLEPLRAALQAGLPVYGTCAGMILLASTVEDTRADAQSFQAIDMTVRRNAFGRQVDSFEADLDVTGLAAPLRAVFIRAPWVERVGADVEVLATVPEGPAAGAIVAVRQGSALATSFHPELSGDDRMHELFISEIVRPAVHKD